MYRRYMSALLETTREGQEERSKTDAFAARREVDEAGRRSATVGRRGMREFGHSLHAVELLPVVGRLKVLACAERERLV